MDDFQQVRPPCSPRATPTLLPHRAAGYAAQGNEFSYQMLMTGNFMLNQCVRLRMCLRACLCAVGGLTVAAAVHRRAQHRVSGRDDYFPVDPQPEQHSAG